MRKRVGILLMLFLFSAFLVPLGVGAEESLPFEYKEPDESVKLFASSSFDYDMDSYGTCSNFRFHDVEGDYTVRDLSPFKTLAYNSKTGMYTGNKSTVCDFGDGPYTSIDAEVYSSFDDAINNTIDNGIIHVPNNEDSYVLFFEQDAKSLSEVVYTCKWSEALSHVGESYSGTGNTMKVELVKEIAKDDGSVHSGEFKVTYDLAEPCDTLNIQGYDLIELKEGKSGSTTVTLDFLTNSDYIFSLHDSDCGYELCSTVYKVDFVKEVEEEDYRVKDADVEPKVTFRGIPKEAYVGETIKIEMITNVNSTMNFNGSSLNNDFAKSNTVEINSNGTYTYSVVSEGGKAKTGVLKIDCFLKSPYNKVSADNYDDGDNTSVADLASGEDTLVQTGIKGDLLLVLGGFLLVIVGGILFWHGAKGGKRK